MQKVKQKFKGGTIHRPGEWLFNEYVSLLNMYMKSTTIKFNPEEIKKVRIIKKGNEYIIVGEDNKTYIADVGEKSIRVQMYQKNKLMYDEKIVM